MTKGLRAEKTPAPGLFTLSMASADHNKEACFWSSLKRLHFDFWNLKHQFINGCFNLDDSKSLHGKSRVCMQLSLHVQPLGAKFGKRPLKILGTSGMPLNSSTHTHLYIVYLSFYVVFFFQLTKANYQSTSIQLIQLSNEAVPGSWMIWKNNQRAKPMPLVKFASWAPTRLEESDLERGGGKVTWGGELSLHGRLWNAACNRRFPYKPWRRFLVWFPCLNFFLFGIKKKEGVCFFCALSSRMTG